MKQPICGLVAMGPTGFMLGHRGPDNSLREPRRHPGIYAGAVINARWADLEPAPGQFRWGPIEQALQAIQGYNAGNPGRTLAGKLRVSAGVNAPDWVKAMDGGPVLLEPPPRLAGRLPPFAVPRFWTAGYRQAWQDLQRHLAARYDADPRLGEVAVSSCSSMTAEPFLVPITPRNIETLHQAGFSDQAFRACLQSVGADYAAWQRTPLDFTFGVFRASDSGRAVYEPNFTLRLMRAWRARLGPRGVLATHGIAGVYQPVAQPIYDELSRLGPPIAFQTISPRVDQARAVQQALGFHPTEIELWDSVEAGGMATEDGRELLDWARQMTACPVHS